MARDVDTQGQVLTIPYEEEAHKGAIARIWHSAQKVVCFGPALEAHIMKPEAQPVTCAVDPSNAKARPEHPIHHSPIEQPGDHREYASCCDAERVSGPPIDRAEALEPTKILVVEDEQIVALELEDQLTQMGHAVVGIVASGEAAIEHARRLQPHLILMDIKLQGELDGIEAAEIIRKESDIPIVYLTAFADEPTLQRVKVTQPYGYILKPFQERELHVIIEVSLYRHRVARELREADAWRHALLQCIDDAVLATGADSRVKILNPMAEALTGWKEQEAIGRPLQDVFKVVEMTEGRSETWEPVTAKRLITKDGKELPIEAALTPIRGPANTPLGAVWVFRDISDSKRVQDRQRFMAKASGEVSCSLDRDMILVRLANLIAGSLGDWCVVHLRGEKRALQIAAFAHRNPEQNAFATSLRDVAVHKHHESTQIENVVQSGRSVLEVDVADEGWIQAALGMDGKLVPGLCAVSAVIVPLTMRDETLGTLSIVSEQRDHRFTESDLAFIEELGRRMATGIDNAQLYAAAQRAIHMRDDVLAIVSHELRNPLSTISLNAEQLLRVPEKLSPQRLMKNAQVIQRSAEAMSRLISDLLDAASIDGRRLSLDLRRHKAADLLANVLSMFEAPALERSINLVTTALPDAEVLCDRDRVLQVLSNLIGNALKFSPQGQSIVVQAEVRGRAVQFSVSDKAGGIQPDQIERIFERYWQAPEALRKGSGLGLYIAKGIVDAHGGRIWVDSTPGVGSTFNFTVPIEEAMEKPPSAP